MKSKYSHKPIHKEVVIIGNGPSGILLSYMLSGYLPHLSSRNHPDEMLAARLTTVADGACLTDADLAFLATGLEGRSTNPVSLLFDSLLRPCADMGLDMESLVTFEKTGREIDHVVLGNGPPGGSWHKMDPHILTLSLANWMSLPGLALRAADSGEKRALARDVAEYYEQYVRKMGMSEHFKNNATVTYVRPVGPKKNGWKQMIHDLEQDPKRCPISEAINYIWRKGNNKYRCCKSKRVKQQMLCDNDDFNVSCIENGCERNVPYHKIFPHYRSANTLGWIVETRDSETGVSTCYTCKYLVLANGCNDVPNKLDLNIDIEPNWLLYDTRTLEMRLDNLTNRNAKHPIDPVVIVGSGLSAADAVIALRARGLPIVHVFRNKSADLNLPKNMYPEYHEVYKMMQERTSNDGLYHSYPEYSVREIDENKHTVTLVRINGDDAMEIRTSFMVVLIGSRSDLSFLDYGCDIGVKENLPVDGKTNKLNIERWSHSVKGEENLYAIGTLAGDNFVRFIPGGALAVVTDLYKKCKVDET